MNHGAIVICERHGIQANGRAILGGLLYHTKAHVNFKVSIYCMYFLERAGVYDTEIKCTHDLTTETTIKFHQRRVSLQDISYRGYDAWFVSDVVLNVKPGNHWFDLLIDGDIVASTLLKAV